MLTQSSHRQKFTGCKTTNVQLGYVGEVKGNLRDGYGVYTYPNSFFRYEGEWHDGIKNESKLSPKEIQLKSPSRATLSRCYGKLKMRDGSFYEGQFANGEMNGTGIRYWSHNGNTYEGEFEKGEMCGMGVMNYRVGMVYEGAWLDNKMEGEGVLKWVDNSCYVGSFHLHKRHGEGRMVFSDESEYEGGWINGMRHGHGVMKFHDGSFYHGQWRADQMNGEGSFIHASGISYDGIWINNRPALEAVELHNTGHEIIMLEQTDVVFSVEVQCRTADNDVTKDNGRLLKISAGIRVVEETNISTAKTSEDTVDSPIVPVERRYTPFSQHFQTKFFSGFHIEPYPICYKEDVESNEKLNEDENQDVNVSSAVVGAADTVSQQRQADHETTEVSESERNKPSSNSVLDKEAPVHIEFPSIAPQPTVNGTASFVNLSLPSVPSVFARRSTCFTLDRNESQNGGRNRKSVDEPKTDTKKKTDLQMVEARAENNGSVKRRKNKQSRVGEKPEETLNGVFCRPGDYVIIVEDITTPPFLDVILDPVYIHIKVQPTAKRTKSKGEKR